MSAGNTNQTSSTDNTQTGNTDQKPDKLAEIQEALAKMIANQEATAAAIAAQNQKQYQQRTQEVDTDENLYDPKKLRNKIMSESQEMFQQQLRDEKAKDAMIWELSQEYPEIKSDQKVRNAILEAQKSLPEVMRDTAQGYETAVLRAVSKAGIIAKSKRQNVDEDTTLAPRGGGEAARPKGKVKLAPETLAAAELMGMDINNPDVIKRLEIAANRDRYDKYR